MKTISEGYFTSRKFKKINDSAFMLHSYDYEKFGVFDEHISVRKTDGHNWILSIMPVGEYDILEEIELIKFCSIPLFEQFIGRLLIEFKQDIV